MGKSPPQAASAGIAKVEEVVMGPGALLIGQWLSGCVLGRRKQLEKQRVWKGSLVVAELGPGRLQALLVARWRRSRTSCQGDERAFLCPLLVPRCFPLVS